MLINVRDIRIQTKVGSRRFRKNLGDLSDLARSIERHGLIHPIVVDKYTGKETGKKYTLVAGFRRLSACLYLGWSEVEASIRSELDDIQRKEIELEENTKRLDLAWPEQVEALRQLDEIKRKIHGERKQGDIGESGWTLDDTAESIGASKATVSLDIQLAKNIQAHPELLPKVAKLPKAAARKVINRELEAARLKKKVEAGEIVVGVDLQLGPAEELIKGVKKGSVHCLITDPPFAAEKIVKVAEGGMQYNLTSTNVSTEEAMRKVYKRLIPELYKVLVPGAHFYIFLGMNWYCELTKMLEAAGFQYDVQPLIWPKCRVSIMAKDAHYMSSYEAILFGIKPPQVRILSKPKPNVLLNFPADSPQCRVHPLQKPFDLLKMMIENSTSPGETVLDCFAGSGITLKVANKLARKAIGFELDEGNYYRALEFIARD